MPAVEKLGMRARRLSNVLGCWPRSYTCPASLRALSTFGGGAKVLSSLTEALDTEQ